MGVEGSKEGSPNSRNGASRSSSRLEVLLISVELAFDDFDKEGQVADTEGAEVLMVFVTIC